jgi:LmbE family N-acetylglucosaminyl deacetylase
MATLVCFHAHPDDEAIATSGTMAKAAASGHRVTLVVATRGEHGEVVEGVLNDGEQLGLRRLKETFASAELIGCARVEFLGYVDSGMMGEPTNDEEYSFWRADVDQAAHRLACILHEEAEHGPVVLTIYDDHGGYGHPDHIQVHRVGRRAAELAGVEHVFQGTMNRDHIAALMASAAVEDASGEMQERLDEMEAQEVEFGSPEALITHAVDVAEHVELKRACMRAHASQISDEDFFLAMPPEAFTAAFGTEWYIALGAERSEGAPFGDDLFADLS